MRMAFGLVDSAFSLKTNFALHYDELTINQRANLLRAAGEIGQYMILVACIALLTGSSDKDRAWAAQILEYVLRRTSTEIGALAPTPNIFSETMKLASQPAAGAAYLDKIFTLSKAVFPSQ